MGTGDVHTIAHLVLVADSKGNKGGLADDKVVLATLLDLVGPDLFSRGRKPQCQIWPRGLQPHRRDGAGIDELKAGAVQTYWPIVAPAEALVKKTLGREAFLVKRWR